MLAIPHHSQVLSMAEIDSKEAQKKLKAGICFRITSHDKHTWFLLSQKKHKLQVQEKKTSAINRVFCNVRKELKVFNHVIQLLQNPIQGAITELVHLNLSYHLLLIISVSVDYRSWLADYGIVFLE
ncbi:hypothetical protein Tco_0894857 [Tanacetum coccineum]|uniref:Uncharacterized protein n=1 Tax=Tanacetum coccineum TaxID=301880 RepID=A0ABQ5CD98_9ASTR